MSISAHLKLAISLKIWAGFRLLFYLNIQKDTEITPSHTSWLFRYHTFIFLTCMIAHLMNNQAKISCEWRTWQRRNEDSNHVFSSFFFLSFPLRWTALQTGNVNEDWYKWLCNTYLLPLWTWNRCHRWSRELVNLWSRASVLQQWCLCLDTYWQKYQPYHHLEKEEEICLKPP